MTSLSPVKIFWHFFPKRTNLGAQPFLFHLFYFWGLSLYLLLGWTVEKARWGSVPSSTTKRYLQSMMNFGFLFWFVLVLWELLLQNTCETFGAVSDLTLSLLLQWEVVHMAPGEYAGYLERWNEDSLWSPIVGLFSSASQKNWGLLIPGLKLTKSCLFQRKKYWSGDNLHN